MAKEARVPIRSRRPDEYSYILVDRKGFVELINSISAVLKKHLKFTSESSLSVDGFEGRFDSAELFTKTLTTNEWSKLKNISVYFYPKDRLKYGYSSVLNLRFGGYSSDGPGLRVDYGQNVSDIQKIAIKQDLDIALSNYTRSVAIKDKLLAFVLVATTSSGLIFLFINVLKDRSLDATDFGTIVALFIAALLYTSFLLHLTVLWFHNNILPHFEAVEDITDTRLKRIGKIGGFIVLAVGFVGTILSIIQFIFPVSR